MAFSATHYSLHNPNCTAYFLAVMNSLDIAPSDTVPEFDGSESAASLPQRPESRAESRTELAESKAGPIQAQVSPWLAPLLYRVAQSLLLPSYFGPIAVEGSETVPRSGPVILAPMHRSRWDAMMVPYVAGRYVTGRDVHFMVSANEMKSIQGFFVRGMGGFPVDTTRPGASSLRCGVNLLRQGRMMVVFPEGNIFRDGAVHPLKAGLARMALQAAESGEAVRVVPIGIRYSDPQVGWRSSVQIKVGQPLTTADFVGAKVKEASRLMTADLEAALNQLRSDLYD
jgi:1-acyl-sn-glycerol-3-phosphate acyltransferase